MTPNHKQLIDLYDRISNWRATAFPRLGKADFREILDGKLAEQDADRDNRDLRADIVILVILMATIDGRGIGSSPDVYVGWGFPAPTVSFRELRGQITEPLDISRIAHRASSDTNLYCDEFLDMIEARYEELAKRTDPFEEPAPSKTIERTREIFAGASVADEVLAETDIRLRREADGLQEETPAIFGEAPKYQGVVEPEIDAFSALWGEFWKTRIKHVAEEAQALMEERDALRDNLTRAEARMSKERAEWLANNSALRLELNDVRTILAGKPHETVTMAASRVCEELGQARQISRFSRAAVLEALGRKDGSSELAARWTMNAHKEEIVRLQEQLSAARGTADRLTEGHDVLCQDSLAALGAAPENIVSDAALRGVSELKGLRTERKDTKEDLREAAEVLGVMDGESFAAAARRVTKERPIAEDLTRRHNALYPDSATPDLEKKIARLKIDLKTALDALHVATRRHV